MAKSVQKNINRHNTMYIRGDVCICLAIYVSLYVQPTDCSFFVNWLDELSSLSFYYKKTIRVFISMFVEGSDLMFVDIPITMVKITQQKDIWASTNT